MGREAKDVKIKARQRILEAAVEAFQQLGYARSTTQAIAEAARVAEVTLFRHFGSKEELFRMAIAEVGKEAAEEKIAELMTGELREDLMVMSRQLLGYFLRHRGPMRMLMFEAEHFPEIRRALAQNPRNQIEMLATYFEAQMAEGRLREADPRELAEAFVSLHFGQALSEDLIHEGGASDGQVEQTTERLVELFLSGVKTD